MFSTIQESVARYKDELREYKQWTDELKALYGEGFDPMGMLDACDWNHLREWNEKLKGMEEVLGLTPEEDNAFGVEVGIRPRNLEKVA